MNEKLTAAKFTAAEVGAEEVMIFISEEIMNRGNQVTTEESSRHQRIALAIIQRAIDASPIPSAEAKHLREALERAPLPGIIPVDVVLYGLWWDSAQQALKPPEKSGE